jgi:hypothetical protein
MVVGRHGEACFKCISGSTTVRVDNGEHLFRGCIGGPPFTQDTAKESIEQTISAVSGCAAGDNFWAAYPTVMQLLKTVAEKFPSTADAVKQTVAELTCPADCDSSCLLCIAHGEKTKQNKRDNRKRGGGGGGGSAAVPAALRKCREGQEIRVRNMAAAAKCRAGSRAKRLASVPKHQVSCFAGLPREVVEQVCHKWGQLQWEALQPVDTTGGAETRDSDSDDGDGVLVMASGV